jgi:maleamate amidohydrolase
MTTNAETDLTADYAQAGFSGRLAFGQRPALLVVDVVEAYLLSASPLYLGPTGAQAVASFARLIAACRATGVPIVYTQVVYSAQGRDGGLFYRKVPALRAFDAGSRLGAIPDAIAPQPEDVIVTKQYASAYFGTSLASTLKAMGVDTVLIGGFSTSGCVRASALDALQHGFAPFVVADACADRDPRPHEANLFDLQAKYAEVISEAEALRLIVG